MANDAQITIIGVLELFERELGLDPGATGVGIYCREEYDRLGMRKASLDSNKQEFCATLRDKTELRIAG